MKRAAAALVVALLVPATAAAARSAKTPSQWLAESVAAAKAASSVHIVASGIDTGGKKLSMDLRLTAGQRGGGRISIGSEMFDLIRLGPFVYFKANATFWRQYGGASAATVEQLLADRWVKVSATNRNFAGIVALTNVSAFVDELANGHGALAMAGTKTIGGRKAVGLLDTSKTGGGTLWIASTGPPLPLQLTETGGSGLLTFESWNAPVHVAAPLNAVDFSRVKR